MQILIAVVVFIAGWAIATPFYAKQGAGRFVRHIKGVGIGAGFLFAYTAILGDRNLSPFHFLAGDTQPKPTVSLPLTAAQLYADYDANEVAADQKYKGKVLRVSGAVESVDKDIADRIVIHLKSPNSFSSVHAYLEKQYENDAASLKKEQQITVVCKGNGKLVGSPLLKECQPG